ncbi:MAG: hypothetical protein ACJ786_23590 [Catenulispora sp.]
MTHFGEGIRHHGDAPPDRRTRVTGAVASAAGAVAAFVVSRLVRRRLQAHGK